MHPAVAVVGIANGHTVAHAVAAGRIILVDTAGGVVVDVAIRPAPPPSRTTCTATGAGCPRVVRAGRPVAAQRHGTHRHGGGQHHDQQTHENDDLSLFHKKTPLFFWERLAEATLLYKLGPPITSSFKPIFHQGTRMHSKATLMIVVSNYNHITGLFECPISEPGRRYHQSGAIFAWKQATYHQI